MLIVIGIIILLVGLKFYFGSETSRAVSAPEHTRPTLQQLDAYAASMTVGMYCALADGSIDRREHRTLQRWKKTFVEQAPTELRSRLESALELRLICSENGVTDSNLYAACHALCTLPADFRLQVMTMAFEVVAADEAIRPSEVKGLRKVARQMLIADAKFKELEQQYLQHLRSTEPETPSKPPVSNAQERLFGINPVWSQEQKLAQLTNEFAKFNSRMQSMRDEDQRARCREMLKDIAQYRDELITGRKPTPPVTQSSAPSHSPQVPPPIASKEEVLLGIDPTLAVAEKLARIDSLESLWRGRLANQLLPAAKVKCEEALQAIARLRDAYRNQT